MPDKDKSTEQVAAPATDRIQMLSVAKDGTPDQAPDYEFIGDKEATIEATKRQFSEMAVAAVDEEKRPELGLVGAELEVTEDKSISELKKAEERAVSAAEKKAEQVVNAAHKG